MAHYVLKLYIPKYSKTSSNLLLFYFIVLSFIKTISIIIIYFAFCSFMIISIIETIFVNIFRINKIILSSIIIRSEELIYDLIST